jgi:hypothetical protein
LPGSRTWRTLAGAEFALALLSVHADNQNGRSARWRGGYSWWLVRAGGSGCPRLAVMVLHAHSPCRGFVGEPYGWARLLEEAAAEHAAQPGRICQLCVQLLEVTGAGISMVTPDGHRGVVCATNEASARIEDLQLTLGEGPCVDAVQAGMPIMVGNLDEPSDILVERWPAFMEGVGAAGVRAVFAFPLHIGAITVGVLDLHRDQPGDLTASQFSAALMAADAAAIALLSLDSDNHSAFSADIGGRATSQMQVHQATGMVKVQLGVTIEEAFLMLRARAFAVGRPVAEVAHDVVERRLRFSAEDR